MIPTIHSERLLVIPTIVSERLLVIPTIVSERLLVIPTIVSERLLVLSSPFLRDCLWLQRQTRELHCADPSEVDRETGSVFSSFYVMFNRKMPFSRAF